jgi:hypothetical protein
VGPWLPARDDLLVTLAAAVPVAALTAVESRVAGGSGFPLDDAWIHLHFARNLAEGAGFAYNPGRPVAGSTAPLWTLLLAAGASVAGPSVGLAKALGTACAVGAGVLTRRAAVAWGARPDVALVAAVMLLWSGPVAWGALSGMEVTLAALLVAAALLAHARGRTITAAGLAALAPLARPEALLLVPFLALSPRFGLKRAAVFATLTVLALAPLVAFSYATVHAPVPATAAAKIEGGLVGWLAGVHEPAGTTWLARPWEYVRAWAACLHESHPLLALTLVPGIVLAWKRVGPSLGIPALTLVAHPVGMALLAPYRAPDFQEGRYSTHLLPLAIVVAAVGLGPLVAARRWLTLLVVVALSAHGLPPAATRYARGVDEIERMQVRLGRWVDANLPRGARLAVNDIGAIAYFSRREIVDLMGLVTPEVIPYRRQGGDAVLRFVVDVCPDYLVIFPDWFPRLAARADLLEPLARVRLERAQVVGAAEMVVYRLRRCAL